jgi:hypothetical protein
MLKALTICFVFTFAFTIVGISQATDQQEKPVKKFELRPSSKDYAPVRRGNSYQPVIRSKTPTLKSQQIQTGKKNGSQSANKAGKRNRASAIRRNRRINNK